MEYINYFEALEITDDWKTPIFRQRIVKEMENIIERSGAEVIFKSGELENRVFSKVKSHEEYLTAMIKIIVMLKNIFKDTNPRQYMFIKQGQPEIYSHNRFPDGMPLSREHALWITKQPNLINECTIDLRRFFTTLGYGRLLKDSGNDDWKSPEFRQAVVAKIESELQKSGLKIDRDSTFMEKNVFLIAKSCPDYVIMVSKIIVHIRNLVQQEQNPDPDIIYLMNLQIHQKNPWLARICNKKNG